MSALDELLLGLYEYYDQDGYRGITDILPPEQFVWRNVAREAYDRGYIEYPANRSYSTTARISNLGIKYLKSKGLI